MFCTNCGRECRDANFCPECGTRLVGYQNRAAMTLPVEEPFPEPGTEAFEARRALLTQRRIPHCPECLTLSVNTLAYSRHRGETWQYDTRFVCLWCGYEWHPRRKTKFKEPIWL